MMNDRTEIVSCGVDGGSCGGIKKEEQDSKIQIYLPLIISGVMLGIGMALDRFTSHTLFQNNLVRMAWYLAAYLPVAYPVIRSAVKTIARKDLFNEFTLMSVATLGAFAIKEYPEAVAVMLFYSVGEMFQERAISRARGNIKGLIDMRAEVALVMRDGVFVEIAPQQVAIGGIIQVRVGERVPLDGKLLSEQSSFDTSALTGESKPVTYRKGENVLAGMVNLERVIEVEVEKLYEDSSLSRILEMVEDANSRKAKTELLIRRFARVYTPIVFGMAVALTLLPYFFVSNYIFADWLYRGLVFLVISCPCALVISVPLGYFAGIGAASRRGILFKGANYLEAIGKVNTVVMDKTGTLTKGVFNVQKVDSVEGVNETELLRVAKAIESHSTHPIARAITEYRSDIDISKVEIQDVTEIAGHGLKGRVDGKEVLAGNARLMDKFGVVYDSAVRDIVSSIVLFAIDDKYAGYITIADELKEDSLALVEGLHQRGVRDVIMLSGDKNAIVQEVAAQLGIDRAEGDLLPGDKLKYVEALKEDQSRIIAFVGDGINDTPVLALSDVGVAMGAMGSDAAIEVADVVIQTDQPSKLLTAINISKRTTRIVAQNITFALAVKAIVLILGALGVAQMWEAVFADVGVTLLAVLNSVRILNMKH